MGVIPEFSNTEKRRLMAEQAALAGAALERMQTPQATAEDRVIEYEVEGHPWASEEGCAPRRLTHHEAAEESSAHYPFREAR